MAGSQLLSIRGLLIGDETINGLEGKLANGRRREKMTAGNILELSTYLLAMSRDEIRLRSGDITRTTQARPTAAHSDMDSGNNMAEEMNRRRAEYRDVMAQCDAIFRYMTWSPTIVRFKVVGARNEE